MADEVKNTTVEEAAEAPQESMADFEKGVRRFVIGFCKTCRTTRNSI